MQTSTQKRSAITIGSFDGVHLGHQQLIRTLVEHARKSNLQSVVITFWPLPAIFFKRAPVRYALTFPEERAELIKKCGVDRVITLNFNQELANLTAEEFLDVLKHHTNFSWMVSGTNFALGKDRLGDLELLEMIGSRMDFQLEVIEPKLSGKAIVSSSQIRQDLTNGKITGSERKTRSPFYAPRKSCTW